MNWLKSRLFWRIIGIYVLLSTLALGGLLITLTERLRAHGRHELEAENRRVLQAICESLSGGASLASIAGDWEPLLGSRNQSLVLLDDAGTIVAATHGGDALSSATLGSLVRSTRHERAVTIWLAGRPTVVVSAASVESAASDVAVVVLQSDVADRLEASEAVVNSAGRAAVVAWLCGTACLAFVASTFVGPLRSLMSAMTMSESSQDRRSDLLLRLSDRPDEFGQIARSLRNVESDRRNKLAELQKSETQVRALATRLSTVLQSMVEGVVAVDTSERILFANDVAGKLMGLEPSEVEGRFIYEAIRSPHVQDTVREAILAEEPTTLEFKLPRGGQQLSLVAAPIRGEGATGAVLVFHDVSEIRRLESMRRDFVSGVSHELKTPLTVIQACTETLLDGAIDDRDAALRFLRQIEEQSERLLQLILGMLQLARVESGEQAFNREPVAVHEIGAQVIQSLKPVAEARSIQLSMTGEAEMYVLADYQALRTVLSNLVDNGIKYTPEGGQVTLELSAETHAGVIRVQDNGVGIPEKHRRRVFERFYRVERDRNRERGGTGLGLAIVKHLCNTMRAELSLHSRAGQGTTVTIRFPVEDGQ
ncbi:MAG: ATP-binding protein [Planctomycetaceae bacterium]